MRVLLLIGALLAPLTITRAASDEQSPLAAYYLNGAKDARDKLHSGQVSASGSRMIKAVTLDRSGIHIGNVKHEMPVELEWLFNGSTLRFQRSEGDIEGSVLLTDDSVTAYREGEHIVRSNQPTAYSQRIGVFDIRMLGQLSLADLELGKSSRWLDEVLEKARLDNVSESESVCKITWTYPHEQQAAKIQRTVYIDGANGFTPIRLETRLRPPDWEKDWSALPVMDRVDVTWKRFGEVAVPIATRMIVAYGEEEVVLKFDWQNINGEVPAKEFSVASIDAPDGTYVVDERLGTPIVESVVGKPAVSPSENKPIWPSRALVALTIVLIIALIFALVFRHAQRN